MGEQKHYHFIGIGGAGMSGLARVLHARGNRATGSDSAPSQTLTDLESELGEILTVGNNAENIAREKPDIVVTTAALKADNPELVAAQNAGIEIISRADLLARVMSMFETRAAITGTHGKTSTTAMAALALSHAGLSPTALVGANVPAWHSNTLVGQGDVVLAESCEAFGSFLSIRPTHTIITNIEADHLDYYKTFEAVINAFQRFAAQTSKVVICCAEDGASELIRAVCGDKLLTYGIDSGDFRARVLNGGEFEVTHNAKSLGSITLAVPGRHNVLNALSVVALGVSLGLPFEKIAAGLESFTGTERRFEILGEAGGALIIDDYAHHPTEIRATLAAARQKYAGRRIVALFQPHLPSRTQQLMDEFAGAFSDADSILISDIYLAREQPIPGVTSQELATRIARNLGDSKVRYVGSLDEASSALKDEIRSGDIVLTLGAGNIRSAGMSLVGAKALV